MSADEEKAIEYLDNYKYDNEVRNAIDTVLNLIKKQQEEIEEYKMLFDEANARKYRKRYLKERRKEQPNLLYPDFDEIYKRYYEQKEEIEKEKEKNKELEEKLKISVAMLTKGTYPEQNKGDNDFDKQFISKDKIKTTIKSLERELEIIKRQHIKDIKIYTAYDIVVSKILELQELLEE